MAADLIRSPAVRLLHARQDHAICLRLAASYRLRIAAGETDQREAQEDRLILQGVHEADGW